MTGTLGPLQVLLLLLTATVATAVVLTRETRRQSLVAAFYGLVLTLLFELLQAPDVALSELAVGSVAVPLMLFVALASTRRTQRELDRRQADRPADAPEQ